MGILRSREELLPVTCAVLSADERNEFFAKIKKKAGGRVEKIAEVGGTNKSVVSDWLSGKANVPYHAMQRLSTEFGVEMPPVSELRREFQAVAEIRVSKPPRPAPPPREERPTQEKKPPREERSRRTQETARPEAKAAPQKSDRRPAVPREPHPPKLSDKAAYWAGVTLAAARREGDSIIFRADRRIGQNFAIVWSRLCLDLFGAETVRTSSEDRSTQEVSLPVAGLEEFIDRLELKEGRPAPGAPRWAWSNPAWKIAFLRGVMDGAGLFRRDPALELVGLSERMVLSVKKLFAGLSLEIKPDDEVGPVGEPSIVLEGREQVKRYFDEIGADNHKLRDQLRAFFKEPSGAEAAGASTEASPRPGKKRSRRGGRGRSRGRGRGPAASAPIEAPTPEAGGDSEA
ncbi:MAG: hypothetical protein AUJ52_02820 [Elusimicrobia bacterium CG1_02_63_36]|nr:MAG: hypothetical protein AUJ52_02820 [Elusimicrobia bacterium CG1_02_63_36]PIP81866.1 MAG: hypothetical protein COR54_17860 [Elusimicrobia bacterium CG22_combo_CG10-13_8_21_14_all_63_91]PJA12600.1 MAG: hypothetical protein COX66_16995 [Elusimicrobia bacterium CG_4_10_14_0_2_um_filter_63_34]PJB25153.1 MAG: hypothetical protein CO113_10075 [Elusimicrobia bacterium CG_4_9_14_3_um_filter_62_55]